MVVGASVYWAFSSGQPVPEANLAAGSQVAMDEVHVRHTTQAEIVTTLPRTSVPTDPEASTIAQYTSEKYQFLFDDLRYLKASQVEQLQRALQLRERLSGEMNSAGQNEALARAEEEIRGLLSPADHATYEMLRESDLELHKLNEYAGGISNVAPLSAADRESILKTKLAYKARFRQLLQDSMIQRRDQSPAEREYAYSITARALEDFRRSYLQEVRQYLTNEEQFALLSNYEATEFKAELAQLQSMVDASSHGGS